MNKLKMFILALAAISLACMETAEILSPTATMAHLPAEGRSSPTVPAWEGEEYSGAVWSPTLSGKVCYVVTAVRSVHVRAGSDASAHVVGYLLNGQVVEFDGLAVDGWMHIHQGSDYRLAGWVNADFFKESECE